MIYLVLVALLAATLTAAVSVAAWRGHFGLLDEDVMSGEERALMEAALAEEGLDNALRHRRLFTSELLWARGDRKEHWRWYWEAGRHGPHTYMRMTVTFATSLNQGISLARGQREHFTSAARDEQRATLRPRTVELEAAVLPETFRCRARDEARLREMMQGDRRKQLLGLDARVTALYLDDRRLHVRCEDCRPLEAARVLIKDVLALAEALRAWSVERGAITQLETGQYEGALAQLEQAGTRDVSESVPESPTGPDGELKPGPT